MNPIEKRIRILLSPSRVAALLLVALAAIAAPGCYAYHERGPALVSGLDVDQSLDVAAVELRENKVTSVLGLWALRDQVITKEQAARVAALYFASIDRIDSDAQKARPFAVWHLTWAISNMYRLNGDDVQVALAAAYADASKRVNALDLDVASKLFFGDRILSGDIHGGGRAYAQRHLVAPGNEDYLQSEVDYEARRAEEAVEAER